MSLSQSDIQRVGEYVRGELPGWLAALAPWATSGGFFERTVRLEEELKAQRELMAAHFEAVDKRFEAVDKRFEAVDRRFEDMNRRFDDVNKRLGGMQWLIGVGIVTLGTRMSLYQFLT